MSAEVLSGHGVGCMERSDRVTTVEVLAERRVGLTTVEMLVERRVGLASIWRRRVLRNSY
jgi:hypothetical protein